MWTEKSKEKLMFLSGTYHLQNINLFLLRQACIKLTETAEKPEVFSSFLEIICLRMYKLWYPIEDTWLYPIEDTWLSVSNRRHMIVFWYPIEDTWLSVPTFFVRHSFVALYLLDPPGFKKFCELIFVIVTKSSQNCNHYFFVLSFC